MLGNHCLPGLSQGKSVFYLTTILTWTKLIRIQWMLLTLGGMLTQPAWTYSTASEQKAWVELIQAVEAQPAEEKTLIKARRFIQNYAPSPLVPIADYMLAEILFHQNNYGEALLHYQSLAQSNTSNSWSESAWFRWGECCFNLGQLSLAESIWKNLETKFPQSYLIPELLTRQSMILLRQGRYPQVETMYQQILKNYPHYRQNPNILLGRARIALSQQNNQTAWQDLIKLHSPEALYLTGQCWLAQQAYSRVAEIFQLYLLSKENQLEYEALVEYYLRQLLEQNHPDASLQIIDALLPNLPSSSLLANRLKLLRGHCFLQAGKYASALETYQRRLNEPVSHKESLYLLYWIGLAYYRQHEQRLAMEWWEKCMAQSEASPAGSMLLLKMAAALLDGQDYSEARRYYELYFQRYPQYPESAMVYMRIAQAYYKQGNDFEAIRAYKRFIASAPTFTSWSEMTLPIDTSSPAPSTATASFPAAIELIEDRPPREDFIITADPYEAGLEEKIKIYTQAGGISSSDKTLSPWLNMITTTPVLKIIIQKPPLEIASWKFEVFNSFQEKLFILVGGPQFPPAILWEGRDLNLRMIQVGEPFYYSMIIVDKNGQTIPVAASGPTSFHAMTYTENQVFHIYLLLSSLFGPVSGKENFSQIGTSILKESCDYIIQNIGSKNSLEIATDKPEPDKLKAQRIQNFILKRLELPSDDFNYSISRMESPQKSYIHIRCEK